MAAGEPASSPSLVARSPISGRQPLDDTVPGQHPAIDREVAAHHEGTHGRVLLRQLIRFVRQVGTVLASIDEHETGEAGAAPVDLVHGVPPAAALAQA
ncbi:hypothetical protein V492_04943 [Pseudogymnoascus sp. VKM F-4246]|nr:hypothetical protein V492_04943 [Pseudogymnoascus sp. VKM F-4246]